ncbi:hypothetical protein Vadar_019674 [Vaccinium darrowii]|nr:hypothetical protein Vadar_019674 [Vaccinium darrowii]
MGVVEAKIRTENLASSVRNSVPANWDYVHNIGTGVVARILFTWNTLKVRAVCISSSMQHITCKIDHVSSLKSLYVTVIYGYNNANDRRQLWVEVRQFYGSIAIEVDDLAIKGLWFTWTSKCGGMGNRKSKLDRAMINSHWQDYFSNTKSVFGAPGISDHSTILVTIRLSSGGEKPFKFFDFWMSNPQFKTLFLQAWNQRVSGQPMARLSLKLKCLKSLLRILNKSCFSDLSKRVMEAKEELVRIQEKFSQSTMDSATLMMEREALLKYIDLSKAEESFERQKSWVQWLALGDQNNKFFHRKMAANTMRKKILSIGDGRGNRVEDPIEVKKLIIQFYKDLWGTGFNGRRAAGDIMLHLLQNKVPEDMKSCLITAVSNLEVKNAMFSIKGDKAPGPDGLVHKYPARGHGTSAHKVFEKMLERNLVMWNSVINGQGWCLMRWGKGVVSWNSLIVGMALKGFGKESLELFNSFFDREGLIPNEITFVGVLYACSHCGMVDKGFAYFKRMQEEFGIVPRMKHYGCMVDLLCMAGLVKRASNVLADIEDEEKDTALSYHCEKIAIASMLISTPPRQGRPWAKAHYYRLELPYGKPLIPLLFLRLIGMFATLSEALKYKARRSLIRLLSHQLLARRFCRNGTVFIICSHLIFGTFLAPATKSVMFAEELITGKGNAILRGATLFSCPIIKAGGLIGKSTQQIWKPGFESARPKRFFQRQTLRSVFGNWAK